MSNSVYFYLLVLAAWVYADETVIDPESAQRMFIVTDTVAYISTTTIPTTVARTCYVTNSSISACRRRRGIEEKAIIISFDDIDHINLSPSKALAVESTATVLLEPLVADPAAETVVHSSVDGVDAEVIDLSNPIEQRKPFFFYIRQNTYTTLTMTSYSTITSGSKSFTINNCLPLGIAYPAC